MFCKTTESVKMPSHVAVIASERVTKNKIIEMNSFKNVQSEIYAAVRWTAAPQCFVSQSGRLGGVPQSDGLGGASLAGGEGE